MTRTIFNAAALALAATLPTAPARAQVARTFLSAAGSDSNNCANVATPCRHLATAFAATAADGEIYVLDPANYGSLTITRGVTIEGHGWASIAPVANNAAITINGNPGDKIGIRGVALNGAGISNATGIAFNSGGSLTVSDSIIQNFSTDGIDFVPTAASFLSVSNTLVANNNPGIVITPNGTGTVSGVLDHVTVVHNANNGLFVLSSSAQTTNLTVSESVISETVSVCGGGSGSGSGVFVVTSGSAIVNVMVRNSTIANNNNIGLETAGTGSTIRVTRSTITGNSDGWNDSQLGVILSYGDNSIDGNTGINSNRTPPCVNGTSPCTAYK
jgi:hypothetical protein